MINNELNLKPCPLCGNQPNITTTELFIDGNRMVIECSGCGLTLDHTQYNSFNESAIDLWNQRTPELGNEGQMLLDAMFPKCKTCKSCPSDYSSCVCMCSEGMFVPQHPPRKQIHILDLENMKKWR